MQRDALAQTLASSAERCSRELGAYAARSSAGSHRLCDYALENVLLHQAAAQQLQVRREAAAPAALVHRALSLLPSCCCCHHARRVRRPAL